jgi:hypothetical protein
MVGSRDPIAMIFLTLVRLIELARCPGGRGGRGGTRLPTEDQPRYHARTVETLDPAKEWLRLSEHYRNMTDEELLALHEQKSDLSDVAQQVLALELSTRRLKPEKSAPAAVIPEAPDSAYAEDRDLVELSTVWSLADAHQLETLLNTAGIPFFIGPEKATSVDQVTSRFSDGLSVQVMQIGLPWARHALEYYEPAVLPPSETAESPEFNLYCPQCRSSEVIFEGLIPDNKSGTTQTNDPAASRYQWMCDACGYQWENDGIAR